ncbi:MAG: type II secretion system protein GspG [bacterium]|nr:type II secretion system protein GspG [bacterium]
MIPRKTNNGFTLIELLIVVAIIAILAAIAIPNFLAAQTRAKVSRTKADMRSIATALEAYYVDETSYPPNNGYGVTPIEVTTPVAYIRSRPPDPFAIMAVSVLPGYEEEAKLYTYHKIVSAAEAYSYWDTRDSVDDPTANQGAFKKYGKWNQMSLGPDLVYYKPPEYIGGYGAYDGLYSFDILYDPTNGVISFGNIIVTQINPSGLGTYKLP